jgi:hypothetical protein
LAEQTPKSKPAEEPKTEVKPAVQHDNGAAAIRYLQRVLQTGSNK